jgi:hypothetical protein
MLAVQNSVGFSLGNILQGNAEGGVFREKPIRRVPSGAGPQGQILGMRERQHGLAAQPFTGATTNCRPELVVFASRGAS